MKVLCGGEFMAAKRMLGPIRQEGTGRTGAAPPPRLLKAREGARVDEFTRGGAAAPDQNTTWSWAMVVLKSLLVVPLKTPSLSKSVLEYSSVNFKFCPLI